MSLAFTVLGIALVPLPERAETIRPTHQHRGPLQLPVFDGDSICDFVEGKAHNDDYDGDGSPLSRRRLRHDGVPSHGSGDWILARLRTTLNDCEPNFNRHDSDANGIMDIIEGRATWIWMERRISAIPITTATTFRQHRDSGTVPGHTRLGSRRRPRLQRHGFGQRRHWGLFENFRDTDGAAPGIAATRIRTTTAFRDSWEGAQRRHSRAARGF